ncbi:MAG: DUF4846 domain-containing protein [Cellulosilyticaceae bacterium]
MPRWKKLSIYTMGCIVALAGCNQQMHTGEEQTQTLEVTAQHEQEEQDTKQQEDVLTPTTAVEEQELFDRQGMTLETRILTPEGYTRKTYEEGSLGKYVRDYPLKADGSKVMLYDGSEKRNQDAHAAVFDMALANRDLQQCADSIMRMYAEYFYATQQWEKIQFHFVDGFLCTYTQWRDGYRVQTDGGETKWVKAQAYDDSYETFEQYLHMVFAYSSTLSMEKESTPIAIEDLEIGDIWLKSGSPGHVVMVVDVCVNESDEKAFMLAQGYMPAQSFHILKNPVSDTNPWYYEKDVMYPFRTPEYRFEEGQLKRLVYPEL